MSNCLPYRPYRPTRLLAVALASLVPLCPCACGRGGGPERYKLSGSVSYEGRPIPVGTILLEPDRSKGNQGPGVLVEFTDGRYGTPAGKGTVGGPHIARIVGYDGRAAEEMPLGRALFSEYRLPVDLPRRNATCDFDVPAGHK